MAGFSGFGTMGAAIGPGASPVVAMWASSPPTGTVSPSFAQSSEITPSWKISTSMAPL
jgi:hypothetical protein